MIWFLLFTFVEVVVNKNRETETETSHLHNLNSVIAFLQSETKQNHSQGSAERDTKPNYWKLGKPSWLQAVTHMLRRSQTQP